MWIAPNILTFTGFLFTCANFVLLSFYDFDFQAAQLNPIPRWVWILAAFNMFMAHTLGMCFSESIDAAFFVLALFSILYNSLVCFEKLNEFGCKIIQME